MNFKRLMSYVSPAIIMVFLLPGILHSAELIVNTPLSSSFLRTAVTFVNEFMSSALFRGLVASVVLIGLIIAVASYMMSGDVFKLTTSFLWVIVAYFVAVEIKVPVDYAIYHDALNQYYSANNNINNSNSDMPVLGFVGLYIGSSIAKALSDFCDNFMERYTSVSMKSFPVDLGKVVQNIVKSEPVLQPIIDGMNTYYLWCFSRVVSDTLSKTDNAVKTLKEISKDAQKYYRGTDIVYYDEGSWATSYTTTTPSAISEFYQKANSYTVVLGDTVIPCKAFFDTYIDKKAEELARTTVESYLVSSDPSGASEFWLPYLAENEEVKRTLDGLKLKRDFQGIADIKPTLITALKKYYIKKAQDIVIRAQKEAEESAEYTSEAVRTGHEEKGVKKWFAKLVENIAEAPSKWLGWIAEILLGKALPFIFTLGIFIMTVFYPFIVLFIFLPGGFSILFKWVRSVIWIYTLIPTVVLVKQVKNALTISNSMAYLYQAAAGHYLYTEKFIESFMIDSDVASIVVVVISLGIMSITYSLIASGSIGGFGQSVGATAKSIAFQAQQAGAWLLGAGLRSALGEIFSGGGGSVSGAGGGSGGGGKVTGSDVSTGAGGGASTGGSAGAGATAGATGGSVGGPTGAIVGAGVGAGVGASVGGASSVSGASSNINQSVTGAGDSGNGASVSGLSGSSSVDAPSTGASQDSSQSSAKGSGDPGGIDTGKIVDTAINLGTGGLKMGGAPEPEKTQGDNPQDIKT